MPSTIDQLLISPALKDLVSEYKTKFIPINFFRSLTHHA